MNVAAIKGRVAPLAVSWTPGWCLTGAVGLHVVLWTLIPALAFETPPLDVLENRVWGAVWEWGYFKHPPLQAWLTQGVWRVLGIPGIYFLSQVCVAVTVLGIFLLGRDAVNKRTGILGAALYGLSYYATIPTPEFNANVLQAPLWSMAGWLLWRAVQRDFWGYWISLGAVIAAALYAKYSVVFLVFGLCTAALALPQGRSLLMRRGPYVSMVVALLLCIPHGMWMVQTDFMSLSYALERSQPLHDGARWWNPFKFIMAQILTYALPLVLLVSAGVKFSFSNSTQTFGRHFVRILALAPLVAMVTFSIIGGSGLRSMWGAPAAIWLGILTATYVGDIKESLRRFWVGRLACMLMICLPVAVGGYSWWSRETPTPQRTAWPGPQLAATALEEWKAAVGSPVPPLVIGPTWEAGLVFHFAHAPDMYGFFGTQWSHNPWVTPSDVEQKGALVVWSDQQPHFSRCGPFVATGSVPVWHKGARVSFHWAVRAPHTPLTPGVCL